MLRLRIGVAAVLCAAGLGLGWAATPPPASCRAAASAGRPNRDLAGHADLPAADPGDVASIDAIVGAFARSVSAPVGGTIDRRRLASLFVPDGRIAIGVDPSPKHAADVVLVSPDGYADLADPTFKTSGFFDRVIANHVERFGIMAHVTCAYGSYAGPDDPAPFRRGVKSFELLQSGGRWFIVEVFYDFERAGTPIPPALLAPGAGSSG